MTLILSTLRKAKISMGSPPSIGPICSMGLGSVIGVSCTATQYLKLDEEEANLCVPELMEGLIRDTDDGF